VSWLDPIKVRSYTVVGSRKMLVYDDIAPQHKVMIFDKRVEIPPYTDTEAEFHASYVQGEGQPYPILWTEPLRKECAEFIRAIRGGYESRSNGEVGLEVVRILEAADKSLHNGGAWEDLKWWTRAGTELLLMSN